MFCGCAQCMVDAEEVSASFTNVSRTAISGWRSLSALAKLSAPAAEALDALRGGDVSSREHVPPLAVLEDFRRARPCIETGWESILVLQVRHTRMKPSQACHAHCLPTTHAPPQRHRFVAAPVRRTRWAVDSGRLFKVSSRPGHCTLGFFRGRASSNVCERATRVDGRGS